MKPERKERFFSAENVKLVGFSKQYFEKIRRANALKLIDMIELVNTFLMKGIKTSYTLIVKPDDKEKTTHNT